MRIKDLLCESEVKDEIVNALMDLFTTYKSQNKNSIPMKGDNGVISYLNKIGHTLTVNELMDVVSKPPFTDIVVKTTPEQIEFDEIFDGEKEPLKQKEQEQKKIEKTAAKVAKKAIKSGDLL